jgi:electron transfer flavoprotein alpha/beta subunit
MLAELLDIPHACGVYTAVSVKDSCAITQQRLDRKWLTVSLPLPCLLIIENDAFYPRNLTLSGILRARRQKIQRKDVCAIPAIDPQRCGWQGSVTRVTNLFVPKHSRCGQMLSLDDLDPLQSVLIKEGGLAHG